MAALNTPALPDEPSDDPRHGMPVVPNEQWQRLAVPRARRCWYLLPHRDVPVAGLPTYVRCTRCRLVAPIAPRDALTGRPLF